jgi:hypothetical protein
MPSLVTDDPTYAMPLGIGMSNGTLCNTFVSPALADGAGVTAEHVGVGGGDGAAAPPEELPPQPVRAIATATKPAL